MVEFSDFIPAFRVDGFASFFEKIVYFVCFELEDDLENLVVAGLFGLRCYSQHFADLFLEDRLKLLSEALPDTLFQIVFLA